MSSKTKSKLPAARIKRIMQSDDDIGKVSLAVPVMIAKSIESFLADIITASLIETKAKGAKKLTANHV